MSYTLFVDELGTYSPKDLKSQVYVLCGCSISDDKRESLKILADQIKFKYWGRTDIVFHSREIAKDQGVFTIFKKNTERKEEFYKDLFKLLSNSNISLFNIVIDKIKARQKGWNEIKIIKASIYNLFLNFVALILTSNTYGKIIIESATSDKDKYYLDYFSYFLSPGFKELNIDFKSMQKKLTSLSFVTKNNYDIEEQITDLFTYGARCKFMQDNGKMYDKESYEYRLVKILASRTFKIPKNAGAFKMKFYRNMNSFLVLPKHT